METIVAYSPTYRTRAPDQQLEIDECLCYKLNHPDISRMVTHGTVPVEVLNSGQLITDAECIRGKQNQSFHLGLPNNSDSPSSRGLGALGQLGYARFSSPMRRHL